MTPEIDTRVLLAHRGRVLPSLDEDAHVAVAEAVRLRVSVLVEHLVGRIQGVEALHLPGRVLHEDGQADVRFAERAVLGRGVPHPAGDRFEQPDGIRLRLVDEAVDKTAAIVLPVAELPVAVLRIPDGVVGDVRPGGAVLEPPVGEKPVERVDERGLRAEGLQKRMLLSAGAQDFRLGGAVDAHVGAAE